MKKKVFDYIQQQDKVLYKVSDQIWDFAETAFEEHESVKALKKVLSDYGFKVQDNVADIATAFSASYGSGKPVIGILGEFDALSGLSQVADQPKKEALNKGAAGHGCGHNMLGVGAVGAALGIAHYLKETKKSGTVIYYGTPGEEGGSGKTFMARDGVFDDLDIALSWHPANQHMVWTGSSLANSQVYYRFRGVAAHAAGNPHQGRSALDAVELMNVGVQFLREHMIPEARVHYAITDSGGYSPNVVQAYAEVLYLIRSPLSSQVAELNERVNDIARGAALMTGTELEIDFVKACSNVVPNSVLENLLHENLLQAPLPEYTEEEMAYARKFADAVDHSERGLRRIANSFPPEMRKELLAKVDEPLYNFVMPYVPTEAAMSGSTDVGDVSWVCPTSQIRVATWVADTPGHSWQIVAQGKGPIAHKATVYAAQVLAGAAIDLLENPAKIAAAKEEHQERLQGGKYICPIPKGVKPRSITPGK